MKKLFDLLLGFIKNFNKEEKIPYIYFGTKIFLTKSEILKFESSTRQEKRRAIGRWKAAIKRSYILPVWKKGFIIGYIKNKNK